LGVIVSGIRVERCESVEDPGGLCNHWRTV
jgi:hypothetical protein